MPGDAKWVVHLDLEAMRASRLFDALVGDAADEDHAERINRFSRVLGIDVRRDLRSATLYGNDYSRQGTTMLATIAGDSGNLEGLMLAAPGYESQAKGDRQIHSFVTRDPRHGDARLFVSLEPIERGADTMLIAAYDPSLLDAAARRLDAPAAGNVADRALTPAAGTFLFARVFRVEPAALDQAGQHSAVLAMMRDIAMELGERDGRVMMTARARVEDEQRGEQLRQLIQGMLAMAQLGDTREAGAALAAEMAQRVRVQRDGAVVTATLDVDAQRLVDEARRLRQAR